MESIRYLTPVLIPGELPRRTTAREEIAEILITDLGDMAIKSPHLIVSLKYDTLASIQLTPP